ncbi:hypothetical protein BDN72DRAFT_834042 [Pluteus cervinus]|uniref:Uncharacterized protein n=1 Tax=Pluteus cervinus TaxID=181527 RepID=A0ACD3B7P9_9AGAR|nr:hypothetical protein BDN72DRAFT_834042 [Pluteus cervinus]
MSTGAAQPTQQQQQVPRKPPFSDWPTIKILTPPQGRFSKKTDEWCFTYCSQNVNGRIYGKEPFCRSICIRKVFPHEIKNVMTFKSHKVVGPDGRAKYRLPAEGQPSNIPRILGGKPPDDSDKPQSTSNEETKYWDEGWYLWTSKSRWGLHEKTDAMLMDLEHQQRVIAQKEQRREVWQDYQDHVAKGTLDAGDQSKWWGPIVPLRPAPDSTSQSLLVPLPPDWPSLRERFARLLAPAHRVLSIFQESISSGEQVEFAQRVWEKAWTNEPYILASRTCSRAYERWKERDSTDEDDNAGPA